MFGARSCANTTFVRLYAPKTAHTFYTDFSKQWLESVANIKLPANFNVLRDEFQDVGHGYGLFFNLTFDGASIREKPSNS